MTAHFILNKVATDSLSVFILKIFAVPIAYFIPLAIARFYGAAQLGTYIIIANLLLFIAVFAKLGLDQGLLRFVAIFHVKGEVGNGRRLFWQAFSIVTLLSGLATLAIFFYGDWLGQRFNAPQLPAMMAIAGFSLPLIVAAFMVRETLKALGEVRWAIFQFGIVTPLSMLILSLIFTFLVPQVILPVKAIGLALVLSEGIGLAFLYVKLGRNFISQTPPAPESFLRNLLRYSLPLFLSSIIMISLNSLDRLILGLYCIPEKVAYYEAATRTASLVSFPLVAINTVVSPLFAKFHQVGAISDLETVANITARWSFFFALPLSLLSFVMAADLLHFFGVGFSEATWALRLLILAHLFDAACGSVAIILAMTGNQWALLIIQACTLLGAAPLMLYGSWKFGLTGLAVVRGAWIVAANILLSLAVWRQLSIRAFASKCQPVILGGIIGIALYYFSEPYLDIVGRLAVFTVGYVAVVARPLYHDLADFLQKPS